MDSLRLEVARLRKLEADRNQGITEYSLKSLEDRMRVYRGGFVGYSKKLEELEGKLTAVDGRITTVEKLGAGLNRKVDQLSGRVSVVEVVCNPMHKSKRPSSFNLIKKSS